MWSTEQRLEANTAQLHILAATSSALMAADQRLVAGTGAQSVVAAGVTGVGSSGGREGLGPSFHPPRPPESLVTKGQWT